MVIPALWASYSARLYPCKQVFDPFLMWINMILIWHHLFLSLLLLGFTKELEFGPLMLTINKHVKLAKSQQLTKCKTYFNNLKYNTYCYWKWVEHKLIGIPLIADHPKGSERIPELSNQGWIPCLATGKRCQLSWYGHEGDRPKKSLGKLGKLLGYIIFTAFWIDRNLVIFHFFWLSSNC